MVNNRRFLGYLTLQRGSLALEGNEAVLSLCRAARYVPSQSTSRTEAAACEWHHLLVKAYMQLLCS